MERANDEGVTIPVGRGLPGVVVGGKTSGIDLDDIEQFPEDGEGACSQGGALVHEVVEQGAMQLDGESYGTAHQLGLAAQDEYDNSERGPESTTVNPDGTITRTTIYTSEDEDGNTVYTVQEVTIDQNTDQIINVETTQR